MRDNWIVIFITVTMMLTYGNAQGLSVNVVPMSPSFKVAESVQLTLIYTNEGLNDVSLYNWHILNKELLYPMFKVTRDGENVKYVGPLFKRGSPTKEDITTLKSGEVLRTIVQLSTAYDMSKAGTYAVQFAMQIGSILLTSIHNLKTKNTPSKGSAEPILQSSTATFYAEGHPNQIVEKSDRINKQGKGTITYQYKNCDQDQQTMIADSIQPAIGYAAASTQYIRTMNIAVTPRYNTWFGTYALTNVIIVRKKFANIYTTLSTQSLTFDCACTAGSDDTFAYVYPSLHYEINLCPMFWQASITGTDSKAGTLVHELSHFSIVAENTDTEGTYGQDACQELARQTPYLAVNNADNFEYFAENNPIIE